MHYATFETPAGDRTWGIEADGLVYDLGPSGAGLAADLVDAIERGVFGALDAAPADAPAYPVDDITWLPPVVDPAKKVVCIGVNYHDHRIEGGRPEVPAPTVFTRFVDSQMGHLQPAVRPYSAELFDYEGEVALVIGKPGYRIPAAEAYEHVAGYAPYNDLSVRDWQRKASQWIPGKNFPSTGAFGPWLVPAAEIERIGDVRLTTRVNGEVRQDAHLDQLIFDIPAIIEYVSAFTPLSVGDVIVTGTPGGVGVFMEPPGLLVAGDVVEVEVSGIGVLRNTIVQEPDPEDGDAGA